MLKTPERAKNMNKRSVRLRDKNRVTIPTDVVEQLHLQVGEQFDVEVEDGRIVLIPVVTIAKDQAWFWTESWQQGEREAEADIKAGRVSKPFDNAEDLIKALHSDDWDEFNE